MRRARLEPYLGAGPVPNGLQVSVEVWERWEGDLRGEQAGTSAPTWKKCYGGGGLKDHKRHHGRPCFIKSTLQP